MALRLELTPAQREDFKIIASMGPDRLASAAGALRTHPAPFLRPGELRTALEKDLDAKEAGAIVRQAIALLTLRRQRRLELESITKAVTRALKAAKWSDTDIDAWERARLPFRQLLELGSV